MLGFGSKLTGDDDEEAEDEEEEKVPKGTFYDYGGDATVVEGI